MKLAIRDPKLPAIQFFKQQIDHENAEHRHDDTQQMDSGQFLHQLGRRHNQSIA